MKNVLARSFLIQLGLTAVASAAHSAFQKKRFGPGMTTLIISYKEMNDIMKIVKSLDESGLLITGVSKTIKNEAKEQKGAFCSILLGTFYATPLENLVTGKGTIRAGEGIIRAG